jgi:hypothetical protein
VAADASVVEKLSVALDAWRVDRVAWPIGAMRAK